MPLYPSSGSMLSPFADGLYRLVYGGLLVRLPEATAVRIGQSLFRSLPVAPLRALAVDDPRLAVDLAGVRLPGPLILSSMYYDPRILRRAMALGFGAVTAKSITLGPRPGHPEPNLVRVTTPAGPGLVNCNGFQNPGLDAFRSDDLRAAPRPPAHRQRRRRVPRGVPAAGREPGALRGPRRDQHLVAEHASRLRAVRLAGEGSRAASAGPGGHAEAGHPEALARLSRREPHGDHPGGPRRRHRRDQLRQHAPRRRATALPASRAACRDRSCSPTSSKRSGSSAAPSGRARG